MRPASQAFGPLIGQAYDRIRRTAREATVTRDFFGKIKRVMAVVPFVDEAVAAYFCAVDSRTPRWVKVTLLGSLAYFIAPADAIPDFIAALGYTDDAAVLLGAVRAVGGSITPEHRNQAQAFLKNEPAPGKAAGDAPIP
jgi:uncharacterized membrane protein YkvA (DUF1232 family)